MRVPLLRPLLPRRAARRLGGVIAVLVGVAALTVVAPAPPAAAATSCYGGAVDASWPHYYTPDLGPYTTSSRCRDINFRSVTNSTVTVCVVFVRHTYECNYETTVGTSWRTIATDVRDGTRFYVRVLHSPFGGPATYYQAKVAY